MVQKALDDNTDAKQISKEKSLFAWDNVFKVCQSYIHVGYLSTAPGI